MKWTWLLTKCSSFLLLQTNLSKTAIGCWLLARNSIISESQEPSFSPQGTLHVAWDSSCYDGRVPRVSILRKNQAEILSLYGLNVIESYFCLTLLLKAVRKPSLDSCEGEMDAVSWWGKWHSFGRTCETGYLL